MQHLNSTCFKLLLTYSLALCGCQPTTKSVPYVLHKKVGVFTLVVGDLTIEFEALQRDVRGETRVGGTFPVAGPVSGSGEGRMLNYVGSDGVVDFTVSDAGETYQFRITDEGTKLVYSDKSFAIGDGPTRITIARDGVARSDNSY